MKLTAPFFYSFDKKDLRRDITCAQVQLGAENGVTKESNVQGSAPLEFMLENGMYVR